MPSARPNTVPRRTVPPLERRVGHPSDDIRVLLRQIARDRGPRWLLREAEIIATWASEREH
ncbi:MAG: hypothetical protein AB7I50_22695 [Vicinamibacterales bacterium]